MIKRFQKEQRVLYLAENAESPVHFVPNINWEEYLQLRLNRPTLCIIFDTIDDAEQGAMNFTDIAAFEFRHKVSVYRSVDERRMLG